MKGPVTSTYFVHLFDPGSVEYIRRDLDCVSHAEAVAAARALAQKRPGRPLAGEYKNRFLPAEIEPG